MSMIHRSPPHKLVGFRTCAVLTQGNDSTEANCVFGFREYNSGSGKERGGHSIDHTGTVFPSNVLVNSYSTAWVFLQNGGGMGSLQANVRPFSAVGTATRGGSATNTWIDLSTYPKWFIRKTAGTGVTRWRMWLQLRDKASLKLISNVYLELISEIVSTSFTPTCPDPEMNIELADGTQIKARDLQVGMFVRAMHEHTREWGAYEVTVVESSDNEKVKIVFTDDSEVKCSANHRFFINEIDMIRAYDLTPGYKLGNKEVKDVFYIGTGEVIHIEVDQAHTYVMEGLLSHNLKP